MPEKKPIPQTTPPLFRPSHGRLGFTAIEISAVATIIAILALILIPIIQSRVQESKIVAARDDMIAIEKAQQLAFAETGNYFRLMDLDRPKPDPQDPLTMKALKVPPAYWNRPLVASTETDFLIRNWNGPYLNKRKGRTLDSQTAGDCLISVFNLFHGDYNPIVPGGQANFGNGPIGLYQADANDYLYNAANSQQDRALLYREYPVDPWGNPYLFFAKGYVAPYSNEITFQQTNYPKGMIYSMGPDGMPGAGATNPLAFFREFNILGTGDDIKLEF